MCDKAVTLDSIPARITQGANTKILVARVPMMFPVQEKLISVAEYLLDGLLFFGG